MRVGIAADHGGFELKEKLARWLRENDYEVVDFGAKEYVAGDDFPDYIIPLARAVSAGEVGRGIAICGSGVGACMVANKVNGVRAASVADAYSAHQGVEHDDMNVICVGGRVLGEALAQDLAKSFLEARFKGLEQYRRRLAKLADLEGH